LKFYVWLLNIALSTTFSRLFFMMQSVKHTGLVRNILWIEIFETATFGAVISLYGSREAVVVS